ncbi:MAG: hypothetical protein DKT66_14085 [Candidatus Melainabacteria bacterium]|nr:MAG: hypothetical protein DKT66_14085 [Candidatus Melainabacteria bacterium]
MPNKIDSLYIQRFRGVEDVHLEGMGVFNLFVGANNSGKTTILEALAACCRSTDPFEWLGITTRRDLTPIRRTSLEALSWIFPQNKKPGSTWVSCELTGQFGLENESWTYQRIWCRRDSKKSRMPMVLEVRERARRIKHSGCSGHCSTMLPSPLRTARETLCFQITQYGD